MNDSRSPEVMRSSTYSLKTLIVLYFSIVSMFGLDIAIISSVIQ